LDAEAVSLDGADLQGGGDGGKTFGHSPLATLANTWRLAAFGNRRGFLRLRIENVRDFRNGGLRRLRRTKFS
jgi:hypothetical protein